MESSTIEQMEASQNEGRKQAADDAAENPEVEAGTKEILENLAVLSQRHRIPSWQLAAMTRYMGWEKDKLVSESEFKAALNILQSRRIGGGRM